MDQPEIGTKIAELRDAKGITQKELAGLCKIDIRTIQRIEAGDVLPRKYTMKLLSKALDYSFTVTGAVQIETNTISLKSLKMTFIAGLVYSVNAILVVIDLTSHHFKQPLRLTTYTVHILSGVLFFYGFYKLGHYLKNQVLAVSSVISIVLLPLINIIYLSYSPLVDALMYFVFLMLCINMSIFGAGILIEGSRRSDSLKDLFFITGVAIIAEACMNLSPNFNLQTVGLYISIASNIVLCAILYLEYQRMSSKRLSTDSATVFG
ncbi:helix-turn-helix domain-containing protein [Mucilaginibacter sp. HMF5004]|uniref:helix-turn-helix domain-containing protein n=1 Tax=Mucilaginibacter rivuli TaxID=2857527 RepID=UPI001C5D6D3C|nr:helix-turn-helix transcriptional regulator [Mucilaginibacter rivuli]MBW4889268.1 helix-turn-helix domain-containing protein [Mucilaginibacter rivuli]